MSKQRGWHMARDGNYFRRVVPSPYPQRIFELSVIELLVNQGVTVVCAGGGGIPVVRRKDGSLIGVEAVIDKDLASALLARELKADVFMMLTDVDGVYSDWGTPRARALRRISVEHIRCLRFAAGSMEPKVQAACEFVEHGGAMAAIGAINDVVSIIHGEAGTWIKQDVSATSWW